VSFLFLFTIEFSINLSIILLSFEDEFSGEDEFSETFDFNKFVEIMKKNGDSPKFSKTEKVYKKKISMKEGKESYHSEKKKVKGAEKNSDFYVKGTGTLRSRDLADTTMSSLKSSSIKAGSISRTRESSLSNETTVDSIGVIDPILYFKKLNKIINKKITIYLVIIPIILVLSYNIVITVTDWNSMLESCANEHAKIATPKLILNIVIFFSAFYLIYQAYFKQKWDIEIKKEYTAFIVSNIICNIVMQLAIRNALNDYFLKYRVYIFQFFAIVIHATCVISPLITIFISRSKDNEKKNV